MNWIRKLSTDLLDIGIIRGLVRFHYLQFILIAIATVFFVAASITIIFGVNHPGFNFGMVLTWVVWWGLMIILFVIVGRGWCIMCPFGAVGEWVQRLSLWRKRKWTLGFNFSFPRRLRNLWLPLLLFIGFIFMDNGYGISNSPELTSGLIIVLVLGAIWTALLFERRTFCLYLCPITLFIGLSSMFAPFEIRRKKAEVCRQCQNKDCYNGNESTWGCPVFEFQGRGMDKNRDCILCTECIKACPHDNIKMRFRKWGHDLWARTKGRLDESVGAITIAALVTTVSLLLVIFLPPLHIFLGTILPEGTPPNDWPRVASISLLYLGGIAVSLLFMYGFSHLSRLASGAKNVATKTFFIHFGYAVLPLGIMKFISDIMDHVFRTWGAVVDVTRAYLHDFPLNRLIPEGVTVQQLISDEQTFLLQMAFISIGLGFSLYVAHKLSLRLLPDRDAAFRAFLPIGVFVFILGAAGLWALSAAL